MGTRSQRKKFQRRRRRAGFAFFVSSAVVVLGGTMLLGLSGEGEPGGAPEGPPIAKVERLKSASLAEAPKVAAKEEPSQADSARSEEKAAVAKAEKPQAEKSGGGEDKAKKDGGGEKAASNEPEIPNPGTQDLYLTVPKMGLYDNYVTNSDAPGVMDSGAIKIPETAFPWENNANPYIAAHVLGYSGTGSYMQFAGLPSMTYGDEVMLTDANGTVYRYAVTEILQVTPQDTWVTNPIPGKDMVTLQTCINPPYYDLRLVVRAERVDVQTAA